MIRLLSYSFLAILFISCSSDDDGYVEIDEKLVLEVPANFPEVTYNLESNPPTKQGFELGKKLFYDGKLSSNGFISCGFCHEQRTAFTHHGHQFSHGVEDREGTRNTPAIQNVAFMKEFTWDGATSHLDLFSIIPITNPLEMDESITSVLAKLQADEDYRVRFSNAFENGEINSENFFKALSQFMLMMVSANSKYDKYVRNEEGGDFTEIEVEGLGLFETKCASCHSSDLFTDDSFRNNGMPVNPTLDDRGRAIVTGAESDNYKFKVPSLRNVEITAPYMHDGRLGSLVAVLDFYSSGVVASSTLDPLLQQENQLGIPLTDNEKLALIAFLHTLTDEDYINDQRFAEF